MIDLAETAAGFFDEIKEIPASGLVFSEEVRKLCEQNACGFYGKNWTCPPAVESLDALKRKIMSFNALLVFYQVRQVKNSFDWQGMMTGAIEFKNRLQSMKKEIGNHLAPPDFLMLGMGSCNLCETCTYPCGEPCRHPEDAIVSLEACGIDVMRLMKDNGLKYYNGKNTVTFIGGLFFHK